MIEAMVPFMENNDDLCVSWIYGRNEETLAADPGLESRITRTIHYRRGAN
jgi:hypothetical protein